MGTMSLLSRRGDLKTVWNPANADEVAAAKKVFDEMVAKGHLAFAVKKDGEKGEQIRKFDPEAGKIVLAPAMRGG